MPYSTWDAMNAIGKPRVYKEYLIGPDGVNALYYGGERQVVIAPGRFVTPDEQIQAFLDAGYPGVTFIRTLGPAPAAGLTP